MIRVGRQCSRFIGVMLGVGVGVVSAQDASSAGPSPAAGSPSVSGTTKATAIEVCGPNGEHAYFDRLRCPDGTFANYDRTGNVGFRHDPATPLEKDTARIEMMTSAPIPTGQTDFHMIGAFTVECFAGQTIVYVDRYHCPDPVNPGAPLGFWLDPGRSAPPAPTDARGPGLTKGTAVEVCGPTGAREYLDRLRCPEGSTARSLRTGNMGPRNDPATKDDENAMREQFSTSVPIRSGQRDFHLIDAYSAECPSLTAVLYLDVFHCPDPKTQPPPPGFSLAKPGSPR